MRRKERIDWLSFRFDIKGIPEAEIKGVLAALEEKRKYYRLANGSLLSLESKEFNEINQFVKRIRYSKRIFTWGRSECSAYSECKMDEWTT